MEGATPQWAPEVKVSVELRGVLLPSGTGFSRSFCWNLSLGTAQTHRHGLHQSPGGVRSSSLKSCQMRRERSGFYFHNLQLSSFLL